MVIVSSVNQTPVSSGIPVPEDRLTYGWAKLAVGESYGFHDCTQMEIDRVRRAAYTWGSRNNAKMTIRLVEEDGAKVLRVWRTK